MSKPQVNKRKIFNDPVYGFITIPGDRIFDIIEHPVFQRLRRIKQLGLAHLVYPGALHTRFHHSLGAMYLMTRALTELKLKGYAITPEEQMAAEVAMLLHDIARDDNRAVVIVTHDERVEDVADRVLWLEDGQLRDRKSERHSWVTDPVCGMRVDRWVATIVADYEGDNYAFCTKRCHDKFVADPAPYAATAREQSP